MFDLITPTPKFNRVGEVSTKRVAGTLEEQSKTNGASTVVYTQESVFARVCEFCGFFLMSGCQRRRLLRVEPDLGRSGAPERIRTSGLCLRRSEDHCWYVL